MTLDDALEAMKIVEGIVDEAEKVLTSPQAKALFAYCQLQISKIETDK